MADNLDQARDLIEEAVGAARGGEGRVDSRARAGRPGQEAADHPKRIVALGAELNVKPATNKPVDIPKARQDIESLLEQSKDGLKQATAYQGISSVAKQAVAAFQSMIPGAWNGRTRRSTPAPADEIQKRFSASSGGAFTRMQANIAMLKSQKGDRGLTLDDIPPQLQKLFVAPDGKILLQVYGKQRPVGTRNRTKEFRQRRARPSRRRPPARPC